MTITYLLEFADPPTDLFSSLQCYQAHTSRYMHPPHACGAIVTVVGNGPGDPSSNLGRVCSHFT